jgi:tetratricopeptide (TPR) repeat protein
VRSWGPALAPGALVLALVGAALLGTLRNRPAGWVGLAVLALLAPSSSVIPITGEWIAEHRMYLPLAGLCALGAGAAAAALLRLAPARRRIAGGALTLLLAAPLALATVDRTRAWSDAADLWRAVLAAYPESPRAHDSLAVLALREGRLDEALGHAREAKRLAPELYTVDYNLGTILLMRGQAEEAVEALLRAREHLEGSAALHANLGAALGQVGREAEAVRELERALALDPGYARAHRNLAVLRLRAGEPRAALPHLARCVELAPDPWVVEASIRVLAADPDDGARDGRAALALAERLAAGAPGAPRPLSLLALALAEVGRHEEATRQAEAALTGARRAGDADLAASLEAQLEAYRSGRPWRERYRP